MVPVQPLSEHDVTPDMPGRERLWLGIAALGLVGAAASLWLADGQRTFGELMAGALSFCF